ncbi:MAG: OsmC family protein [Pseudomonadota bacterium]
MATREVAAALARAEDVFRRRPTAAHSADAPATAAWSGGVRMLTRHARGLEVATDLPVEFGGAGDGVSPGWLMRAGLAACTATSIVMTAAREGLELSVLDVRADSLSDNRGVLAMCGEDGAPVDAAPLELSISVTIGAERAEAERLRDLVDRARLCSPLLVLVERAAPLSIKVDVV